MSSSKILVMRHAEKAADPLAPDLSEAGRERAKELARYIPATFGKPDFLLATAASKHSRRPIETLKPLSRECDLKIDKTFADQDYGALAQVLRKKSEYQGALIVVCWHHGNIPSIAHALDAREGDYPDSWDRTVFNLVLQFDFVRDVPNVKCVTEPF
jgi:broad specificity phosphatase PhoE